MPAQAIRSLHRAFGKGVGRAAPGWLVDRYRRWTTDVYVVSFPKSGRTWFRTILGTAVQLQFGARAVDPTSVHHMWMFESRVPRLAFTHDVNAHLAHPSEVRWDGKRYRGKKIILLVRDPRDTIVSLYFEMSKRVHAYEGTIGTFIRQETGGFASLIAFLNAWMDNVDKLSDVLMLTYEDLHARPKETVAAALEFSGIHGISDGNIEQALDLCSFDKMRSMERAGIVEHTRLRPGDIDDPQSYKVRSGKVAAYREYLSLEDCDFLDSLIASDLHPKLAQYKT